MYDSSSPFREGISDLTERRIEAAKQAGFEVQSNKKFPEVIEKVLLCENDDVNEMIIDYVRLQKNVTYSFLVTLEEAYSRSLKKFVSGKAEEFATVKKMQAEIEKCENKLLSQDNNRLLVESLYDIMEYERLELRPEDIARKLENGETPITKEEISED